MTYTFLELIKNLLWVYTKEITLWWSLDTLISLFLWFYFSVFSSVLVLTEKISQTLEMVFAHISKLALLSSSKIILLRLIF